MTATNLEPEGRTYRSLVPARMDRLPWTRFHTRVVIALGIAWILDGLEITIVAEVSTVLRDRGTLALSGTDVALVSSCYLFGQVVGALFFGRITDRFGRKKLFFFTLALYLIASGIAGLSFSLWFLLLFRFLAGAGIGGEYAAITSAIDELIPPYYRGRVEIAINGTYWFGAILGAGANVLLLDPDLFPVDLGWRIGFFIGPVLCLAIIFLRRAIPESPRWLMTHGREVEAERIVDKIETRMRDDGIELERVPQSKALVLTGQGNVSYLQIAKEMRKGDYPRRSFVGFSVMVAQAFLYNGVFFTYSQVLARFYGIESQHMSWFFIPFAAGNLAGPLILGKLFDTIGRRKMITFTYCVSGILLAITAWLFSVSWLNATTQTVMWCVIFFFASTGASSAYLTISEVFPLELRAQAISFFFAISQLIGAVSAPLIFGYLVKFSTHGPLAAGYLAAGAIMFAGGVIAWCYGVDAERKSLERIANPLSAVRLAAIKPADRN